MNAPAPVPAPAPALPPEPSQGERVRAALGRLAAITRWLFAAPPPDPNAPPQGSAPRRAVKAVVDWFLPPLSPIGPAPHQDYHALAQGGRLYQLANAYPLPTWRPQARLVITLIVAFIIWGNLAVLDEVAIAEGEVIPEGKVKVIQHLEGGIIRDIHVTDGATVRSGDPLVQLDLPVSSINRDELQVRIDGYLLQKSRLEAEINGTALQLPAEEAARQPDLAESERRNYTARQQAHAASVSVLEDQLRGKAAEINELETKLRGVSTSLRLARERFAMSEDLLKSGLTARMEHVQLQAQMEDLQGQMESIKAGLPRAQAAHAEATGRIGEEKARFRRTAQTELAETELNIARTRELLNQASDQQFRTQIVSPIDGVVKNLRYNTIGGVVKPGDPIMEIVPLNEKLQVEAKLSPADRGYVQVGQQATVKVSAYDYTTYGGLGGTVILVAPDTTMGAKDQPHYRVLVQTDRAWVGDEAARHAITAGMQATVEIHTGTRTVMQFLIKPVLKLRHEAFRER